jgi:hypothetical protein
MALRNNVRNTPIPQSFVVPSIFIAVPFESSWAAFGSRGSGSLYQAPSTATILDEDILSDVYGRFCVFQCATVWLKSCLTAPSMHIVENANGLK